MKTIRTILIVIAVVGVLAALVIPVFKPRPIKVKKIDVEKVGKTVGDIRRKFLKGYHDTTTVKEDTTNVEK